MMDFIYELYQNDNFVLYLTIALVILIILFVLVLIFGKRDQKLEETKRLQKIDVDAFKEEQPKEEVKVEVPTPEIKEEVKPVEVNSEDVLPEIPDASKIVIPTATTTTPGFESTFTVGGATIPVISPDNNNGNV